MAKARAAAKVLLARWGADPERFAREALGVRRLAPDQSKILRAVAEDDRVACRSGQKTGKSTACAILGLWWPLVRRRGYCVMTAPSFPQVKDPLWAEVQRLYRTAKHPLGGEMHIDPAAGWTLPGDRKLFCRTTDKPERLQGISSPSLLVIVDEASGYPEELWSPLLGNLAAGGKLFAPSNPTRTSGYFFNAFGVNSGSWTRLHLKSTDTPNVEAGRKVIPGLATHEWVEERKREWGEASAAYQVRVLGNFPTQGDNAVVPMSLVLEAQGREAHANPSGTLNIGIDVARFGDDETVIQPVRGRVAYEPTILQGFDNVDVAGEALLVARSMARAGEHPVVKVDVVGNGGGVADVLARTEGIKVVEVNVSESATDESYHRLRDQLWFGVKDWLSEDAVLPPRDDRLMSELVAPLYGFDVRGRQQVQSKDEIKKSLGRSPDRADALALAVYQGDNGTAPLAPQRKPRSASRWGSKTRQRGF